VGVILKKILVAAIVLIIATQMSFVSAQESISEDSGYVRKTGPSSEMENSKYKYETSSTTEPADKSLNESATVASESNMPSQSSTNVKKFGVGFSFGERIFYPQKINDLSSQIWEEMKSSYYVVYEVGSSDMYLAYSGRLNFLFAPVKYLNIMPYMDILWGPKYLTTDYETEYINLLCYTGGLNVIGVMNPDRRFSFKGGAGFSFGGGSLYLSGDAGNGVTMDGSIIGFNLLAGFDINLSRVKIGIDFVVPIQNIDFNSKTGSLESSSSSSTTYTYPGSDNLTGLEIREGVTFMF
jgi:hypothetical protein